MWLKLHPPRVSCSNIQKPKRCARHPSFQHPATIRISRSASPHPQHVRCMPQCPQSNENRSFPLLRSMPMLRMITCTDPHVHQLIPVLPTIQPKHTVSAVAFHPDFCTAHFLSRSTLVSTHFQAALHATLNHSSTLSGLLPCCPMHFPPHFTDASLPMYLRSSCSRLKKPRLQLPSYRTDRAPSRPTTDVEQTHTLFPVVPEALHHRLSFPHSSNSSQIDRYRLRIQSACPQSMTPPRNAILHYWPPCHFPLSPQPRVNGRLTPSRSSPV